MLIKRDNRQGQCSDCKKHTWIQNKTKVLCAFCVYKRNHGGKTMAEVIIERSRKKKPVRKNTGERELFMEIWHERNHFCENCGDVLHEPQTHNFAHKKPKSTHPHLRLVKTNIMLLCYQCHYAYDHQGKQTFDRLGGRI
jgi:5-methylcytosine-specific restriction endonuclease McrA